MQAPNIFRNGMDEFDRGYARTGKVFQDVAARRAGTALAGGDRQGAMAAFGAEGLTDDVRDLQRDQQAQDSIAFQQKRQTSQDARVENNQKGEAFLEALAGLSKVPQAERRQALAHPVWSVFGITPEMVQSLSDDDLSDAAIQQFGEQVKYQIVNRGGGGYDVVNMDEGKRVGGVEPDPKMVSVAGGATLYDPETRAPVYTAPKSYAPRGGGRGGGGSSSGVPAGFVLD